MNTSAALHPTPSARAPVAVAMSAPPEAPTRRAGDHSALRALHHVIFTGPAGIDTANAVDVLGGVASPAPSRGCGPAVLDHGICDLGDGEHIRLLGTPAAVCARIIRAAGPTALVILIDNARPDPIGDLIACLDACGPIRSLPPLSIGVSGLDQPARPRHREFRMALSDLGLACPVLAVDVRRRGDLLMLVDTVLAQATDRD